MASKTSPEIIRDGLWDNNPALVQCWACVRCWQ